MSISVSKSMSKADDAPARRIELFTWRREARQRAAHDGEPAPLFVPAVIETVGGREPVVKRRVRSQRRTLAVELEIDGVIVRALPARTRRPSQR
jgi:transposase-like protein